MRVEAVRRFALILGLAAILAGAWSATARADASPEAVRLDARMRKAIDEGDFPKAIEIGLTLVQLAPDAATPPFNLACAYARNGEKDQAVRWLRTAADRGFRFVAMTLRDKDLDSIREHPGYTEALDGIRLNSAVSLERFKLRADADAKVLTQLPDKLDRSRPVPLIVVLHGYGGNAGGMIRAWKNVAADFNAVLIAPQALDKAGEGFSWTVHEETEHLVLRAIEEAKKTHKIDPARIVLTGFSQGGLATYNIALHHPEMFIGAIPFAGIYDPRVTPVPEALKRRLPRFVILIGEQDGEVEGNRVAAGKLEAIQSPVLLKVFPGVGHGFPPHHEREFAEALRFVLE